jgi:glucose-6-phosphate 1-dehydrogenase
MVASGRGAAEDNMSDIGTISGTVGSASNTFPADALVFFGATGDLAHKKIFPALQALAKRGHLDIPVIGVAKAGWTLDQLKSRARDSVEHYGGLDLDAFARVGRRLRYIGGDYGDAATFQRLRRQLGDAKRAIHYLAIPPSLFETVIRQLGESGCARGARVVIEKPFGRDLVTAQRLNAVVHSAFSEENVFRIDHYLGKTRFKTCCFSALSIRLSSPCGIGSTSKACRSQWRKNSASRVAESFTTRRAPCATSCRTIFCKS